MQQPFYEKKQLVVFLLCTLLPLLAFAQRRKKPVTTTISVATTANYYPALKPYSFFSSFTDDNDQLLLKFLTASSGIFSIREGESVLITRQNVNEFPSQLLGIGAGVRIMKNHSLFHEFSLTKLSFVKSSYYVDFIVMDTMNMANPVRLGYDQNASAFGFRYEMGRYFGDAEAGLRFGISGGLEPSFYFYKRTPFSSNEFPLRARIITLDIAVIPMLSARLSKKVALDFKVIPNMLIGDFSRVVEENPLLPGGEQGGERAYNSPEVNVAFSLLLRYEIHESRKKR